MWYESVLSGFEKQMGGTDTLILYNPAITGLHCNFFIGIQVKTTRVNSGLIGFWEYGFGRDFGMLGYI